MRNISTFNCSLNYFNKEMGNHGHDQPFCPLDYL